MNTNGYPSDKFSFKFKAYYVGSDEADKITFNVNAVIEKCTEDAGNRIDLKSRSGEILDDTVYFVFPPFA